MTEKMTLREDNGTSTRVMVTYPSGNHLVMQLTEKGYNYAIEEFEVVAEGSHLFELADDGETVVVSGEHWREYTERRFNELLEARGWK